MERLPAGAVPFPSAQIDHNQRSTARAQQQGNMLRLLLTDSQRSDAPARLSRESRLIV